MTLPHTVVTSANKFLFADPNHKLYCQTVHSPVLSVTMLCLSSACCPCTRLGCQHVTLRTFTQLSTLPSPDKSHPGRSKGGRKCCPTHFTEGKVKYREMCLNNNRAGNSPDVTCFSLESKGQDFIKILIPTIKEITQFMHFPSISERIARVQFVPVQL